MNNYEKSENLLRIERMMADYNPQTSVDELNRKYKIGVKRSFANKPKYWIRKCMIESRKMYQYQIWFPGNMAKTPMTGVVYNIEDAMRLIQPN